MLKVFYVKYTNFNTRKDVSWLKTFNNSNQHIKSDEFDGLIDGLIDGLKSFINLVVEKKSVDEKKKFFLATVFIKIAIIDFWVWNDFSNQQKNKKEKS